MSAGISAAGSILYYLEFTEHKQTAHISSISRIERGDAVWIDRFTIRNLELFSSNSSVARCSFIDTIDRTLTPMGGRQLKRWVAMPLMDVKKIAARQDVVEKYVSDSDFAQSMRDQLSLVADLERIASRIATERITPRELIQLKHSLRALEMVKALMESTDCDALIQLAERVDPLMDVVKRLESDIYPDPETNQIHKGGIIASGVSPELDELRSIALHGKDYLRSLQSVRARPQAYLR